jgi:DNA polymerase-3 subunit alpha
MLTRVKTTMLNKGKSAGSRMAMLTVDDGRQNMEAVTFADVYAMSHTYLEQDAVVLLRGRVDRRREEPNLIVDEVVPIDQAEHLTERVRIVIEDRAGDRNGQGKEQMKKLQKILDNAARRANGSAAEVNVELHQHGTVANLRLNNMRVAADAELANSVQTVLSDLEGRRGRCELLGPAKAVPANGNGHANGRSRASEPLGFTSRKESGEVCESVDRF